MPDLMNEHLEDTWPTCTYISPPNGERCTNKVNPRRVAAIGVCRCLEHPLPRRDFTIAPAFNKGGYQLITHGDIEDIGR